MQAEPTEQKIDLDDIGSMPLYLLGNHPAEEYCRNVLTGETVACRYVKLACLRHIRDLETGAERGLYFDRESAIHRLQFYAFCRHFEGEWAGQVIEPSPWQQFVKWNIYGWKKQDGTRRFRTVYEECARKNGKALALDTPIPTPGGWTQMGDLVGGDSVFDENGNVCKVISAMPVQCNRPCYTMTFSDKSQITADAEHEWETEYKIGKGAGSRKTRLSHVRGKKISTTEELKRTLTVNKHSDGVEWNHRVLMPGALELQEKVFPLDPYVLGCWLGDGCSVDTRITCSYKDTQIIDEIAATGTPIHEVKSSNENSGSFAMNNGDNSGKRAGRVSGYLREAGLYGNKHIPIDYLRASKAQRLSLLQGLMDTDGYASKAGQCEFTTIKPLLRDGVLELINSLGMKVSVKTARAMLDGKDCGEKYRIIFTAYADTPVFRLKRKLARQKPKPEIITRNAYRQIISIEPTESVPVRCIQVDSENGLFLAGKSFMITHNSTDLATDGLYLAFFDDEPGAQCFTAATKKDQAIIIHRASTRMVKASPALRKRIAIFKNNLNIDETASKYEPLGEDSKTEDGRNVHAGLIDEYHAHPSDDMYNVLRSAMGARRQPILYVITTAGFDKHSACYTEREYAVNVLEGVFDDDSFFAIIFTPDDPDKWTDETQWMMANPNLNVCVSIDDLRDQCRKAERVPSKQNEFKTKRLNIWTESQTAWITADMWRGCNHPVDADGLRGQTCYGAFDLSSTIDITGWVKCFPPTVAGERYRFLFNFYVPQDNLELRYPNREVLNMIKTWIRQGFITATPGNVVDYDFIEAQIIEDASMFDIVQIPYDPYNAAQLVTNLQKQDLELVEFRQGFRTMSPAAKDFEAKILQGLIAHGGNPVMNWMISCAEIASDPSGSIKPVKPDRGKSNKRIDGVIASIMALSAAVRNSTEFVEGMEVW